jgi:CRISPR-associated protein Cas6
VAESAHGWQRPQEPDALLHLSRRTKLVLRLPKERIKEATRLTGEVLDVGGHSMRIGEATTHPLSRSTSLFARRVLIEEEEEEASFIQRQIDAMHTMAVHPKKILPGLAHPMQTPKGQLCARLLSVEGLTLEESFQLQMQGLGEHKYLGCGIFIPHKPLANVRV